MADAPYFGLPSADQFAKQQREAELNKFTKQDDVFNRMLVGSAYDLARQMGVRDPQEAKLQVANKLFQDSQADVTATDPTEARLQLLSSAARKFNAAGLSDLVQQIGPELITLQKQVLENRKLTSEASENDAQRQASELATLKGTLLLPTEVNAARTDLAQNQNEGQNWVGPDGQRINLLKSDTATANALRGAGWTTYNASVQSPDVNGLTKKTQGELEATSIGNATLLDTIKGAGALFDPTFLTYKGKLSAAYTEFKDRMGLDPNPAEAAQFAKYTAFIGKTQDALNDYILNQTGKQMSIKEAERLKAARPNEEDSPRQYIAKYREAVRKIISYQRRAELFASKGAVGSPWESIADQGVTDKEVDAVLGPVADALKARTPKNSSPGTTGKPDAEGWVTLPNGMKIRQKAE